ncbi:MAG: hypothetical protein CL912_09365 [Deltaproteobacteria bacterium]|nr:hypothetical protein [Deltaproteobacteria bacterium]
MTPSKKKGAKTLYILIMQPSLESIVILHDRVRKQPPTTFLATSDMPLQAERLGAEQLGDGFLQVVWRNVDMISWRTTH